MYLILKWELRNLVTNKAELFLKPNTDVILTKNIGIIIGNTASSLPLAPVVSF